LYYYFCMLSIMYFIFKKYVFFLTIYASINIYIYVHTYIIIIFLKYFLYIFFLWSNFLYSIKNIFYTSVVCGRPNRKAARLLGGEHTESHEFPWLANIHIKSKLLVSGVLINDRYILTAASQLIGLVQSEIFSIIS